MQESTVVNTFTLRDATVTRERESESESESERERERERPNRRGTSISLAPRRRGGTQKVKFFGKNETKQNEKKKQNKKQTMTLPQKVHSLITKYEYTEMEVTESLNRKLS